MAKKNYTPEEMQAKMEKKSSNCAVFFGTFTKALAVFLAIVIAWSLVVISFTAPSMGGGTVVAGPANGGESTNTDNSGSVDAPAADDENLLGGDETTDVPAGDDATEAPAGDDATEAPAGDENADAPAAAMSKADVAKLLNDATKNAVKANYKWERKCYYTSPLDVGDATETLNRLVGMVDKNANLDSVVGGFLGITGGKNDAPWDAPVTAGKFPADRNLDDKYLMKAFALTEGDIKDMKVNGNKYMLQLNACKSPQKDNKNALHHVTNDFITKDEVNTAVLNALGSVAKIAGFNINGLDVDFTAILVTAVVENNALKSVEISYTMTVNELNLKALGASIVGKGAGKVEIKYTMA